jgi:cysteine-rich repeat protein
VLEHCGDGVLDPGEYCDDGNLVDYDECPWNCRPPLATRLTVGGRHACVALGSTVRCWGDGADGENGAGTSIAACTVAGAYDCAADPACCIGDDELPASAPTHDLGADVLQIDAALNTCAVLEGGNVACWGPGYEGVLGPNAFASCGGTQDCASNPACCIGDDEPLSDAVVFDFAADIRQVAVGDEHACVLDAAGAVRCWGAGTYGRLGYGNEQRLGDDEAVTSIPAVALGAPAVFVAAGALASCAALETGEARCWGACLGPEGVDTTCLGQPGDPATVEPIGDDELPSAGAPLIVEGEATTSISVGRYHACSLSHVEWGDVRCWGDDVDGADGYPKSRGFPENQMMYSVTGPAGSLSVGTTHACVPVAAARLDPIGERVVCWGHGGLGATGYATTENPGRDFYPLNVDVPPPQSVSAGNELTCALTIDEEVYCWGAAAGPHGIDGAHGHPGAGNIGDDETPMSAGPVSVW